jgi:Cu(I)/Ag(I) efflux system protein CusF
MTAKSAGPFGMILIALVLAACASPGPVAADASATDPAIAVDLGSSDRNPAPESDKRLALAGEDHGKPRAAAASGAMQMAHAGQPHAQGTGIVNSVDASGHKINLTHGPIPALGWPGMTMEFAVAPAFDLRTLKPGTRVDFTIEQGDGGNYEIKSVKPAGGGR